MLSALLCARLDFTRSLKVLLCAYFKYTTIKRKCWELSAKQSCGKVPALSSVSVYQAMMTKHLLLRGWLVDLFGFFKELSN